MPVSDSKYWNPAIPFSTKVVALIAKVTESAARCISAAVSVLDGALVHVQTFAADSAHYLHANGGKDFMPTEQVRLKLFVRKKSETGGRDSRAC